MSFVTSRNPQPQADEIVIAVEASGICGSDLHAWHGRHPFRQPPVVLGHGARTARCTSGDPTSARSRWASGWSSSRTGSAASAAPACAGTTKSANANEHPATHDWTDWPGRVLRRSRQHESIVSQTVFHWISLPLPSRWRSHVHANRRAGTGPGMTVNIVGSGTIGLLCLMVARHLDAEVDVVTDIDADKLCVAEPTGARRPSDVRTSDIVGKLRDSRFDRADITIVAATAPDGLLDAAALTRARRSHRPARVVCRHRADRGLGTGHRRADGRRIADLQQRGFRIGTASCWQPTPRLTGASSPNALGCTKWVPSSPARPTVDRPSRPWSCRGGGGVDGMTRLPAELLKTLIAVLTLTALVMAATACTGGRHDTIQLRLGHVNSATDPWQISAQEFADLVNENSNGAVEVKVYPGAQLGGDRDMVEGMQIGSVDFTSSSPVCCPRSSPR